VVFSAGDNGVRSSPEHSAQRACSIGFRKYNLMNLIDKYTKPNEFEHEHDPNYHWRPYILEWMGPFLYAHGPRIRRIPYFGSSFRQLKELLANL
jgi:hypothetical protein